MGTPVIVEAVRTPLGKRNGWMAGLKPMAVLAHALNAVVGRSGIDAAEVEQVFAGCVTQAGEQGGHIGRYSWLYAACRGRPASPRSTRSAGRRSRACTSPRPRSRPGSWTSRSAAASR